MGESRGTAIWLQENWFKVGILAALLLAIALVAYYYMVFLPGVQAANQARLDFQSEMTKLDKEQCVNQAELQAVDLYEHSGLCTGPLAPATCKDHQTYFVSQYRDAYNTCLQSKGLR